MANAKKCDICGKFYQEHEPNLLETLEYFIQQASLPSDVRDVMHKINQCLDICSSCEKSIEKMLVERKNGDGKSVYCTTQKIDEKP